MHISPDYLRRFGITVLLGMTLTACGVPAARDTASLPGTPVPSPTATAPTTVAAQPTAIPAPTPTMVAAQPSEAVIGFKPQVGGPGTSVAVWGTGYAPNAPVVVRLGFPQPMGEVLASAVAGSDGRWEAQLVIPERLPSGERITQAFRLVAMNDQNEALASAAFNFIVGAEAPPAPAPELSLEAASQSVRDLLSAWSTRGDYKLYLAANLRDALAAGRPAEQVLGLQPITYGNFSVHPAETRASEVLFVPATLNYGSAIEERVFTLVVENGQWRTNGSSLVKSTPIASTIRYLWPMQAPIDLSVQSQTSRATESDWLLRLAQPHAKDADVIISGGLIGEAPGEKLGDVVVRGVPGVSYTFPGGAAIVWQEDNNNYGVSGNRSVEELLKIANGLQEIDRATWEQRAGPQ